MIKPVERIRVTKETDLVDLLDSMADTPVLLERKGMVYRLAKEKSDASGHEHREDIWAGYDRQRARQAWRSAGGSLQGIDAEQLIEDIHAQREQDSSGRPG